MGRGEADKLAVAEDPVRSDPGVSCRAGTHARVVDRRWHVAAQGARRATRCSGMPRLRRRGSRGRALRQDPPVRRGRAWQAREPP